MKTLNGKNALMKVLVLVVLVFAAACGENNTSGKNKNRNNNYPWGGTFGGGGTFVGGNGNSLPANWLDQVAIENPCLYGGQRAQAQLQVQANVNVGALYVGVTSEGDMAIVNNQNGLPLMTLYICPRPDLTGQGTIIRQPITENSVSCPVGQISSSEVSLQGQYGQYRLNLRPIHIPNAGVVSSLCVNNGMF